MPHRDINEAGLDLIKSFESFVPFPYDDMRPAKARYGYLPWDGSKPIGTPTIGYGHTNDAKHPLKVRAGMPQITEAEACHILDIDLDECEDRVSRAVKVPLSDNQFAALVSFDFNTGAIFKASFVRALNAGDYNAVRPGLMQWVKAKENGELKTLRGLVRRREAEAALFTRKDVARKVPPVPVGDGAPTATVIPEPPVTDQPLTQSGVVRGAVTAGGGGAALATDKGAYIVDSLTQAEPHISSGTVFGFVLGLVIVAGAAYALYSRVKAAGQLPEWWPTWAR